jgi:hypothetical protein
MVNTAYMRGISFIPQPTVNVYTYGFKLYSLEGFNGVFSCLWAVLGLIGLQALGARISSSMRVTLLIGGLGVLRF